MLGHTEKNSSKMSPYGTDVPLKDLAQRHPHIWQDVITNLRKNVSGGRGDMLAAWRQGALADLARLRLSPGENLGPDSTDLLKAQMTLLAIDQFVEVTTGKSGLRPSLKDRAVMSYLILPRILNQVVTTIDFDRRWGWLNEKIWAAAELQRQSIWSVPTLELIDRFTEHCQGKKVLELGAGRGLLYGPLRDRGLDITAVDDQSWHINPSRPKSRPGGAIETMDAREALNKLRPDVVLCSWPPAGNTFEEHIFESPSVRLYLAVVSRHSFASGNWSSYKNQTNFDCSISEPLNRLLRPLETEQQVLIFRRKN